MSRLEGSLPQGRVLIQAGRGLEFEGSLPQRWIVRRGGSRLGFEKSSSQNRFVRWGDWGLRSRCLIEQSCREENKRWKVVDNKARRLIFMIRRSFQDFSKLVFMPYEALVRPHLEYDMPACSPNLVADINHLERIQRLATRLVTGIRHLPYEDRLQLLGLHSLQRRRLRVDLITAFKIIMGLLDVDPNLPFLPPLVAALEGTPARSAFSMRASGFRRYSSFCQHFQHEAGESLDRSFFHLHRWLKYHHPNLLTPPPNCTPPINGPHLDMLPKLLLCQCGFFRNVVAYFLVLYIIIIFLIFQAFTNNAIRFFHLGN